MNLVKLNRFHHVGVGTQGVALGKSLSSRENVSMATGNRFQIDVTLDRPSELRAH